MKCAMSSALLPVQMVFIEHCHNHPGNRRKPRICSKPPTEVGLCERLTGAQSGRAVIMSLFRGTKSESGDSMPSFEKQRVELLKENDLVGVFGARHASAAIAWFEPAESSFLGMRLRAISSKSRTDLWQRRHAPSTSERSLPPGRAKWLMPRSAHRSAALKQTPSSKPNDGKAVVFNNARSLGYLAIHATLHRPFYEESAG
jgi:hypothetical protein